MTMQVGMIGTDGIVLASDTKHVQETSGEAQARSSFDASKIKLYRERGIAISCARNMETALKVADAIVSELSDSEMNSPGRKIEIITQEIVGNAGYRNDVNCLIVLQRPRLQLLRLRTFFTSDGCIVVCEGDITGKTYAGDLGNAAIFWGELYYEKRPMRQLARVAAQLIVMAGRINSGSVDGLEVVLCDHSNFRRLSADSNAQLESAANRLDKTLRKSLASYANEFTYTPDVIG